MVAVGCIASGHISANRCPKNKGQSSRMAKAAVPIDILLLSGASLSTNAAQGPGLTDRLSRLLRTTSPLAFSRRQRVMGLWLRSSVSLAKFGRSISRRKRPSNEWKRVSTSSFRSKSECLGGKCIQRPICPCYRTVSRQLLGGAQQGRVVPQRRPRISEHLSLRRFEKGHLRAGPFKGQIWRRSFVGRAEYDGAPDVPVRRTP